MSRKEPMPKSSLSIMSLLCCLSKNQRGKEKELPCNLLSNLEKNFYVTKAEVMYQMLYYEEIKIIISKRYLNTTVPIAH